MGIFKHVLAATDFSEASEPAVELAITIARDAGADLTLVHACEIPVYPDAIPPVDLLGSMKESARAKLAKVTARVAGRVAGLHADVRAGAPWEEILAAARDAGADLVVVGTHGRRGVSHALLGSVAERVVRLSPVPVLTVRAAPR